MVEPTARDLPHGSLGKISRLLFEHTAFRYLIIGGFSFILDFGMIYLFHVVLSWQLWIATALAFLASFVFNYTLQRAFSFSSRSPHGRALVKYTVLVAANTVITVVIVDLLNSTAIGWGWGKVISTLITTVSNYFVYRRWIFPDEPITSKDD